MANPGLLVLAFDFPPVGGSGVQRTLKFVKYLPSHGWDISVLTVRHKQTNHQLRDDSLLAEIPESVNVIRSSFLDPYDNVVYRAVIKVARIASRIKNSLVSKKLSNDMPQPASAGGTQSTLDYIHSLIIPDRLIGWLPFAVLRGFRMIRQNRPAIIFTTSPCETSHVAGYVLSKLFSIPHVADFRDPWTNYYFSLKRPYLFDRINRYLERKVLNNAALVLSTADECSVDLKKLTSKNSNTQFSVITNGYDESDFNNISPRLFDKFTIIFNGTVYRQVNPENLLKAVRKMLDATPALSTELQLLFIGNTYEGFEDLITQYKLEDVVICKGYLPHRESIEWLMGADVCYYNVLSELAITAKLFEYLRSGTHILATIPCDHSAARIIRDCRAGEVVEYIDIDSIALALNKRLYRYRLSKTNGDSKVAEFGHSMAAVEHYERKKLTARLSEDLLNVV